MSSSNPGTESKTEAILISGFLGSGKTTLLKHLLEWKGDLSDTVIIMNEFGDVSIDGLLVDKDVEMVELVNGCICCTLQLDLRKQIERMVAALHPKWMIMEATGLADSGALIEVLAEYTEKGVLTAYHLATVIDAQIWPMRNLLGPVFNRQLECADLILVNKIDTLAKDVLENCLAEIAQTFPRASIEPTTYCRLHLKCLHGLTPIKSKTGRSPKPLTGLDSTVGWTSFTFIEARPLDEQNFHRFLDALQKEIFRLKGLVQFPGRAMIINHVNGATDWIETAEISGTKLVFIGRGADMDQIEQKLKACIAAQPPGCDEKQRRVCR